jgi:hypothetical protein
MIDVKAISLAIIHKSASKGERVWSADKRTSVAINVFGPIDGQAYVQSRNLLVNIRAVPERLAHQIPCITARQISSDGITETTILR